MNKCIKKIDDLAKLESFDPSAFEADETVSQDVCNFVLTLALIFNDLKDLVYADITLATQKPVGSFRISRLWGSYNGIQFHLVRLIIGLFNEIIELIKKSDKVIADPFFQSVLKKLSKQEREIWHDLVSVATVEQTTSQRKSFTFFVRNKLVFHYEPKEIYRGYQTFFRSGTHGAEKAFISRGNNMEGTRLFFADAAVNGYFRRNIQGKEADKVTLNAMQTLADLTPIFMNIIHQFIQKRGFAYKAEAEET